MTYRRSNAADTPTLPDPRRLDARRRAGTCRSRSRCRPATSSTSCASTTTATARTAQNIFAGVRDVAGEAGIQGASTDPFDWGVPNLSFTSLTSLRDRNPTFRLDQRFTVGDVATRTRGKHNVRFGGDYRAQRLDSETDANARGSFVFTGLYTTGVAGGAAIPGTGSDLADFLLGQRAAGLGPVRPRPGLVPRPCVEPVPAGRLAREQQPHPEPRRPLRVRVAARGAPGPPREPRRDARLHGRGARASRADGARTRAPSRRASSTATATTSRPRVGVAWKPKTDLTVRAGFGINYNLGAYGAHRAAPRRPAALRRQQHAARHGHARRCRSATGLTLPGPRHHELVRHRQELRARARCCSGTSTCSGSSATTSWSGSATRARAATTSTWSALPTAAPTGLSIPGRGAVPLGVVGRHVDPARGDAARPQAAEPRLRRRLQLHLRQVDRRRLVDRRRRGGGGAERPGPRGRAGPVELRPAPPARRGLAGRAARRPRPEVAARGRAREPARRMGVERDRHAGSRARLSPRACSATSATWRAG